MKRTSIINYYLSLFPSPKSYLEIGVRNPRANFLKIKADVKDGVDPAYKCNYRMTSDEFFNQNTKKYYVIFIDGLHTHEQAYRDVINSLEALNHNGVIVMHDCNPTKEECQSEFDNGSKWNGTVWKAFVQLRCEREDLEMFVIDADYGVGIIRPNKSQKVFSSCKDMYNYTFFAKHKIEMLNLISVKEWQRSKK